MSRLRIFLAWLAVLALIATNVHHSWTAQRALSRQAEIVTERTLSIEERMLLLQAEALIGSKYLLSSSLAEYPPEIFKSLDESYRNAAKEIQSQLFSAPIPPLDRENNRYLLRDKALIAARLGDYSHSQKLLHALDRIEKKPSEGQKGELDESEKALIEGELLDFAPLLFVEETPAGLSLPGGVQKNLSNKAARFLVGTLWFMAFTIVALCLFFFYAFLFLTKRTKFAFERSQMATSLPAETFALYLLSMTFASDAVFWLNQRGYLDNILIANVIFILSTLIIILWPLLSGVKLPQMRRAYGLYFGSPSAFLKNLFIAPTFYAASWVVFGVVLVMYGFLLEKLSIEVSKGAHPIVPLLLSSNDSNTSLLIALLATAVAPFIEEIMFRGALYSGLRNHLSAKFAIPISAFLFAAIHPQGVIGLVPLTFIGIMLAFLREWRGSLLAPMLAHACVNAGTLLLVTLLFK